MGWKRWLPRVNKGLSDRPFCSGPRQGGCANHALDRGFLIRSGDEMLGQQPRSPFFGLRFHRASIDKTWIQTHVGVQLSNYRPINTFLIWASRDPLIPSRTFHTKILLAFGKSMP